MAPILVPGTALIGRLRPTGGLRSISYDNYRYFDAVCQMLNWFKIAVIFEDIKG